MPFTANATGRLYQPSRSADLTGVTLETCGAVASYLKAKAAGGLAFPARSTQPPLSAALELSGVE